MTACYATSGASADATLTAVAGVGAETPTALQPAALKTAAAAVGRSLAEARSLTWHAWSALGGGCQHDDDLMWTSSQQVGIRRDLPGDP